MLTQVRYSDNATPRRARPVSTERFHAGASALEAVIAAGRVEMLTIFAELRSNIGAYGRPARTCQKPHEAQLPG